MCVCMSQPCLYHVIVSESLCRVVTGLYAYVRVLVCDCM